MDDPISTAPAGSDPDSSDDRSRGSTLDGVRILGDPALAAEAAAQLGVNDAGGPAT
jgi:hypothetical protein